MYTVDHFLKCTIQFILCIVFSLLYLLEKTGKRGEAQRDGGLPLLYRRRTFEAICENFVTMATGMGWGSVE